MADAKMRYPAQNTQGKGKHGYLGEDVEVYDPETGKKVARGTPLDKIDRADLGQAPEEGEVSTPVGNRQ